MIFSTPLQVPGGSQKKEMLENLDRVPTFVQQLQFTVKNTTVGKAATFTKVSFFKTFLSANICIVFISSYFFRYDKS